MSDEEAPIYAMPAAIAERLRRLAPDLDPATLAGTREIYAPLQREALWAGVRITRDISYGTDERHRLDLFTPQQSHEARPVLVFVHGGGFVGGDKSAPGSPFFDNVGVWAARHGMIGVTITYRLAPQHPWPAGPLDIAAALRWVRESCAEQGGDEDHIFLMGHSAGACHAATYIGHPEFHIAEGGGIAGGILVSGLYDMTRSEMPERHRAYFGEDAARYGERSALPGIAAQKQPLLIAIAEREPLLFHRQALELVAAICERDRHCPRFLRLDDHNHYSAMFHLNTAEDVLGSQIRALVATGR